MVGLTLQPWNRDCPRPCPEDAEELLAAQHLAAMAVSPASSNPHPAAERRSACAVGLLDAGVLRTLGSTAERVPASAAIGAFYNYVADAVAPCPVGSCQLWAPGTLVVDGPTSVVLMQQAASLVRIMHEELLKSQEQVRLHGTNANGRLCVCTTIIPVLHPVQVAQLSADLSLALAREQEAEARCRNAQAAARDCGSLLLSVIGGRRNQPAQSPLPQGQQQPPIQLRAVAAAHAGHPVITAEGQQPAARSAFQPVESRHGLEPTAPTCCHEHHGEPASAAWWEDQRQASTPLGRWTLSHPGQSPASVLTVLAASPPAPTLSGQLPSANDSSAEQRSDPNSFSFYPRPPAGLAST